MARSNGRGRFSGSRGGMEKSIAQDLMRQINTELAKQIRNAGVEICNGLSEAGPAWSGEFSASWDIVPAGGSPRQRRIPELSSVYEYTYRNFPLKIFEKALESRQATVFNIVNTAPHAAEALDMVEGNFYRPADPPIKNFVGEGFRPYDFAEGAQVEHYRYQLSQAPRYDAKGNPIEFDSAITAEKDWFPTYARGGGLQRDLARGMQIKTPGLSQ